MRNDLKDEPSEIPSLLIDDLESIEKETPTVTIVKKGGASKRFIVLMVVCLFILYSIGGALLFLFFKQSTDDLRYQLEQATHTAASAAEISQQQALTSDGLKNIRSQNEQLTQKLAGLTTKQNTLNTQLAEQAKRLAAVEQQTLALANSAKQIDQIKQLSTDLVSLKKSQDSLLVLAKDVKALQDQNLSQSLKSVQDDLLLLRAQIDKLQTTDTKQSATNQLAKQVESLQAEVGKLRQQVSNMSPY